jgi:hypothetical protein
MNRPWLNAVLGWSMLAALCVVAGVMFVGAWGL